MVKKVNVYGVDGSVKGEVELPAVFDVLPRYDLIKRAVVTSQANAKQPQGRDPLAGKRNSSESWQTGFAAARVPRLKGSGYPGARGAAFVPGVIGGRLAHPPRSEKVITKRINKKERRLALKSAISATALKELVEGRGHECKDVPAFPLVVDDKIQTMKLTREVLEVFSKLGLMADVERTHEGVKIRAGKGKRRGRRLKRKVGPLIVVAEENGIDRAARNIEGVEVVSVKQLNVENLAPGTHAGRLTLWTQGAIKELNNL